MSMNPWHLRLKNGARNGGKQHTIHRSSRCRRQIFEPRLETLEDRSLLSTLTVLNLNDSGPDSLRQAVLDANASPGADLIKFQVAGTIVLTSGQMTITDDLTIHGNGQITISGNQASRVFQMVAPDPTDTDRTEVELRHLSIVDGLAVPDQFPSAGGGGISNVGSHLTLSHVTMANNQAFASLESGGVATAGAVDNFLGASLVVRHSRFVGNKATGAAIGAGGAILIEGTLSVRHSQFIDNEALTLIGSGPLSPFQGSAVGGAISGGSGSDINIAHSHFASNLARGGDGLDVAEIADGGGGRASGGAIFASPISLVIPFAPVTVAVEHTSFRNNQVIAGSGVNGRAGGLASGGAMDTTFLVTANIASSAFFNNAAMGGAGGEGAAGQVGGLGGTAWGGAYSNAGGVLAVERSTFHGNIAQGGTGGAGGPDAAGGAGDAAHGGAIASTNNIVLAPDSRPITKIARSTFTENAAHGGAGGVGSEGSNGGEGSNGFGGAVDHQLGTMIIMGSRLAGNQAVGGVGGLASAGGQGGNGGSGLGGGIANDLGGTLTVSSTTVVVNRASGGSGGAGGGNGGPGQGGGLWNSANSTLTLSRSRIVANKAKGGTSVDGTAGLGTGGGVYNLGIIDLDAHTQIFGNLADLLDECFGC